MAGNHPSTSSQPPGKPEQRPASPGAAPAAARCDVCGGPTYESHCKIICRHCGYTRDCSDL